MSDPLSFPDVGVVSSTFRLQRVVGVSASPFTGAQQVYEHQGAWWEGEITLPPLLGAQAGAVRAFLARLHGQAGTFLYGDPDNVAAGNRGQPGNAGNTTNLLRNSVAAGAVVGVVGSGGSLPTNWGVQIAGGLTTEVVGTGTASNGLPYVRVKISGTPSGTIYRLRFEAQTEIAAVLGTRRTGSFYASLAGGALTNTACYCRVTEQDAGGVLLGGFGQTAFTPTATPARAQHTRYMENAACAYTNVMLALTLTVGLAVDLTLDLAGPQIENRSAATPLVPTSGAVASRPDKQTVVGAGQTGTALLVTGFAAEAAGALKAGDYISLGTGASTRLHLLTADVDTDVYGRATLALEPALRASPADGAVVEVTAPRGVFRLTDNAVGWSSGPDLAQAMVLAFCEVV